MSNQLKLLLIEDSEDDALLLLRLLQRGGYDVDYEIVETAPAMLDALDRRAWDIIISDYALPQFSGMSALQLVQRKGYDIPFIIISGTIGEEHAVSIIKAGADDYLMKDNLTRLFPAIERAIREQQQRAAHRQAEATIHRLTRALSQSASLVIMTDASGVIEYVNQALVQVSGYDQSELIGSKWDILRDSTLTQDQLTAMRASIRENGQWQGELLSKHKGGSTYWVHTNVSAVRDDEGTVTQFLVVQEDITRRKHLEQELQHYTEQLEQMVAERTAQLQRAKEQIEIILNNSTDGIVLALSSGDIQTANPAFRSLFGERVQRSIEEILHSFPSEKDIQQIAQTLITVLYDREDGRTQASIINKSGDQVDVDLSLSPVKTPDGDARGVVVSVRDITQLKDLQRFKEDFIANAAHDLSSPIATLKTHLYLLKARPERVSQYINVLEQQTHRLDTLVRELRTLSELDRGALNLQLTPTDLNAFIRETTLSHQAVAREKGQTIQLDLASDLPAVAIDHNKFERILVNLLTNAINYTPSGGTVTLTTRYDPTQTTILLTVSDTGIGIQPESLPHIFRRFYRTDRAKDTNRNGTGLGLAIVKEIIEAHRGQITATSEINVGTTFTIKLTDQSIVDL